LKLFKTAISDGSKDRHLKLKIQGFASIAPVRVNGDPTKSYTLNCKIANERAEALIYFLTLADGKTYNLDTCKAALKDSRIWQGRAESDSIWEGRGFTLDYNPWEKYAEMAAKKPEKDNSSQSRQRDLEFRNRSVRIIIEEVAIGQR